MPKHDEEEHESDLLRFLISNRLSLRYSIASHRKAVDEHHHGINEFVEWYCSEPRLAFNGTVVLRYRIQLEERHAPRLRRYLSEMMDRIKRDRKT